MTTTPEREALVAEAHRRLVEFGRATVRASMSVTDENINVMAKAEGLAKAAINALATQKVAAPEREALAARCKQLAHVYADAKLMRYGNLGVSAVAPDPDAAYAELDAAIDALAQPAKPQGTLTDERIETIALRDEFWSNCGRGNPFAWKPFARAIEAEVLTRAEAQRDALTPAARDVLAERQRQISVEGWTPEHDDGHLTVHGEPEMAIAAACYAMAAVLKNEDILSYWWPWGHEWWKPTTPRRNLVKAAALAIAEIERLDRAALVSQEGTAS